MRRAPALLAALIFVLAAVLPAPVLAAPCDETPGAVRFDVNPKTDVAPGSTLRFTFKFRFTAPCDGEGVTDPSVILVGETRQTYNSIDSVVRRTPTWDLIPNPEFRDATDDNWDFNIPAPSSPGTYLFRGRVLLDDRQITESASVTVTVAGEAPTGGPTTSGGEPEPAAGPVPLEVTIGSYASAVDIPSYVTALYRYGLGVGVTLAMVMVVVGGFQYMTARGNPSAVGAARGRITNAILGLLLLLGSFTLLQTINPDLVTLRNIIVPEIQTVETLTANKCEDFDRATFTVTPTSGRCGEDGTVARQDGTRLATNTCTWGVCSGENEACVLRGRSGYGCVACPTITQENLSDWGLSENDAACRRFRPISTGSTHKDCVYAQDSRFDAILDVCALATIDCSAVRSCGDYDAQLMMRHGSTTLRMEEMIIDQYGGGSVLINPLRAAPNFPNGCRDNPCDIPSGCHAVPTTLGSSLSTLGPVGSPGSLVATVIASISGDLWDCMEGAR
ncbi:hypothetical protein EPO33_04720 [Patescibacteria group bacterium]|nr:MAG: hypothetical protein EPO33_04720 [Patescibacteria group bacterium]